MSLPATVMEDTRPIKPCQKFEGHTRWVQDVIHLPGGQQIMTCSLDGSLGVWNLQTGKHIANWQDGRSPVRRIALSVDGRKVVSGSSDGTVRLWSIEAGKVIAKWTGHTQSVWSVCWDQDGERVLSGSGDGTARVWDAETGNTILEINTGLTGVHTATFSPDLTLIATSGWTRGSDSEDKRIKIWDGNTGKLVAILKGHTNTVNSLAWTADGRMLISGSVDFTIRTWNTSTWQQLAVLMGHTDRVRGITISANGRILASVSDDNTARLWNLDNGQPIDGTLLATGCRDKNAYTWDVSEIIKEAGLSELLDGEKSFLNADATHHPAQKPNNVRTIPTNFFAELSSHPDPDIAPPISLPVVLESAFPIPLPAVPEDTPPEAHPNPPERSPSGLFKWFRLNTPARPTFLQRVKLPFFKQRRRQDEEGIELKERPPSIVDVPLSPGLPADVVSPVSSPAVAEGSCPIPLLAMPEDAPPEVQLSSPELAQPTILRWDRPPFFRRPQRHDNEAIELQERPPSIVDVPLAHTLPRNYSVIEARRKRKKEKERARQAKIANKEKARQAKIAKKFKNVQVATKGQSPTQNNIIQQSSSQSQAQPSSQSHSAAFTPSAAPATSNPTPVPATVSVTPAPATVTLDAGCWTLFLHRIGCVSAPHAGGHP